MKRLAAIMALASFAFTAGAADIYQQFAQGNSDLRTQPNHYQGTVQRGVGANIDRYQGWADGNSDLFSSSDVGSTDLQMADHQSPNVYRGFSGNPDLR
jgi:hypothetical protein